MTHENGPFSKRGLQALAIIGTGVLCAIGYNALFQPRPQPITPITSNDQGLEIKISEEDQEELKNNCSGVLSYVHGANDTIRLRDVTNLEKFKDYRFDGVEGGFIFDKYVDLQKKEAILSVGYGWGKPEDQQGYRILICELETGIVKIASQSYQGSVPAVGASADRVFLDSGNSKASLSRKGLSDLTQLTETPKGVFHGRHCPDEQHEFDKYGNVKATSASLRRPIENGFTVAAQRWLPGTIESTE